MTVKKVIKKEMGPGMGNGMKDGSGNGIGNRNPMPSNDAPMPPAPPTAPIANEIPDHTHPEYDEMLVKIQEIQDTLSQMAMGGINEPATVDSETNPRMEKMKVKKMELNESFVRKIVKEELAKDELKGEPEMDQKKSKKSTDSAAINIPQTTQPANGIAPSGGEFDSEDKLGNKIGDAAQKMADKPKSDYSRPTVQKNALIKQAKTLMEQAKKLLKEANETEDPTTPMPGKTEVEPDKMDGEVPNKSPTGGTESPGKMSSQTEELNIDIDADKDAAEDEEDEEKKSDAMVEKVYNHLKKENSKKISARRLSNRQSFVGASAGSKNMTKNVNIKTAVNNTVKEYLKKSGYNNELQMM